MENQLTKIKLIYQIICRQLTAKKVPTVEHFLPEKLGYLKKTEPKQQKTQSYKTTTPPCIGSLSSLCREHSREQTKGGEKKASVIFQFYHLLIYYYCLFKKVPPLPERNHFFKLFSKIQHPLKKLTFFVVL